MGAGDIVLLTSSLADSCTALNADDILYAIPYSGGFYVKRGTAGTLGLTFSWAWITRVAP